MNKDRKLDIHNQIVRLSILKVLKLPS